MPERLLTNDREASITLVTLEPDIAAYAIRILLRDTRIVKDKQIEAPHDATVDHMALT
jgi:hypothetical protein